MEKRFLKEQKLNTNQINGLKKMPKNVQSAVRFLLFFFFFFFFLFQKVDFFFFFHQDTAIQKHSGCNKVRFSFFSPIQSSLIFILFYFVLFYLKMTCSVCSAYFCYICGKLLAKGNPYDHFSEVGSRCYYRLFDET